MSAKKVLLIIIVMFLGAAIASYVYLTYLSKPSGTSKGMLTVASWNGSNFGRSKSDNEIRQMAEIVRNFDVVAIQEVSTSQAGAQAIARLSDELNRMGSKWDYIVSDPTHDCSSKERFGFLWQTSRIEVVPRHAILVSALAGRLEREPAKINIRYDEKYLTLYSFHLAPTEKGPANEAQAIGRLTEEFSKESTILVGDFNLPKQTLDKYFENLSLQGQINEQTSYKSKAGKNGEYLSKSYDNIYVSSDIIVRDKGVIDFMLQIGDLEAVRELSDHMPVYISIEIGGVK